MITNYQLNQLNPEIKKLLSLFIFVLTIGVGVGLIYLSTTASSKFSGIEEHYNGSVVEDEFDIPVRYPKTINNLLLTTHNHLLSLSLIFLSIGLIFSFNSIISGKLKWFFIYEPFFSIIFTFGGIWGLRFISSNFLWIIAISGSLMYLIYFLMAIICMYELLFKNPQS